ncbi:MAG: ferredoxin [Candidatus Marinimicrobia bacterium]|nr:ferredoxin [Candidatus Neomarinimicrobiota bacterium]|tara:strand:+ start:6297 stop:6686 length:390 start_codon:yes stop_codon:yes gene_type:complete
MVSNSSKYKKHILVCVKERPNGHPRGSCIEFGGMDIRTKFVQLINKHNLKGIVRASKSGCLDICEVGPNVVIYPQNIWYTGVTIEDVEEIFLSSVLNDEIVKRLVATAATWGKWSLLRTDSIKKLKEKT